MKNLKEYCKSYHRRKCSYCYELVITVYNQYQLTCIRTIEWNITHGDATSVLVATTSAYYSVLIILIVNYKDQHISCMNVFCSKVRTESSLNRHLLFVALCTLKPEAGATCFIEMFQIFFLTGNKIRNDICFRSVVVLVFFRDNRKPFNKIF
jgi:hypothetical protein